MSAPAAVERAVTAATALLRRSHRVVVLTGGGISQESVLAAALGAQVLP